MGLKINAAKTKLMRIGTKRGDSVLIAGERVEEVDEFTYLGSTVSKKGGTDEDIQGRIGKARQAFAMLKPVWRSTALTTRTKLRIFRSNVKAVLLYGSETWRLTKGLKQKLQVFITLRRSDGHVAKRALEWNPQGKRKRGRPRHTWRRTRMSELEERELTWREAKDTAQNRVRWRVLVEDLCSIRNEEE